MVKHKIKRTFFNKALKNMEEFETFDDFTNKTRRLLPNALKELWQYKIKIED